jgi:hypothetical protein
VIDEEHRPRMIHHHSGHFGPDRLYQRSRLQVDDETRPPSVLPVDDFWAPREDFCQTSRGGGVVRASAPASGVASRPTGVSVNEPILRLSARNLRRARTPGGCRH